MTEQYVNDAETTLDASIDDTQTTLVVDSASAFPTQGNFRIRIGDELLLVTGVSSTTFTATRGVEGTTPASHGGGANVTHVLTAASLRRAVREGLGIYHPPKLADFAWVNQGSAAATEQDDGILLTDPSHGSDNLRLLMHSAPSTPYTVTAAFCPLICGTGSLVSFGMAFRGSGGALATLLSRMWQLQCPANWNSPTSFGGSSGTLTNWINAGVQWMRLKDDGTNRMMYVSADGINWVQTHSISRTTTFTPVEVGFFLNNYSSTPLFESQIKLLSWRID